MLQKLQAEADAILAWSIIGATEWYEHGLMVPERVRAASEAYADAMDSLGLWLTEDCEHDADARESAGVLHAAYRIWKQARTRRPTTGSGPNCRA